MKLERGCDGRLDAEWRIGSVAGRGTACAKALWYGGAGTFKDPKGLCDEHAQSIARFPNS